MSTSLTMRVLVAPWHAFQHWRDFEGRLPLVVHSSDVASLFCVAELSSSCKMHHTIRCLAWRHASCMFECAQAARRRAPVSVT